MRTSLLLAIGSCFLLSVSGCTYLGIHGSSKTQTTTTLKHAVADASETVQFETIKFQAGISSATVERLGKDHGCEGSKGAGLITEKGPVEVYRMQCNDGTSFLARCELRQCKAMNPATN
ncbi:MAG: hypothetical protein K2X63_08390 [Burkholderiaceae bacterium]|nr:hypothetical protein [Burkholderiaceae bacterium]